MAYTEFDPFALRVPTGNTHLRGRLSRDGVAINADVTPTVSAVAIEAGTVTVSSVTTTTTGNYAAAINVLAPDRVTATWTATVTTEPVTFTSVHEVRGDRLFTIDAARQFDTGKITAAKMPNDVVAQARDLIWELFEQACNVAFGTRYTRFVRDGSGTTDLPLPVRKITAVRSITIDGTAINLANVDVQIYDGGTVYLDAGFPLGRRNVVIGVEHGYPRVPQPIRRAALLTLKDTLLPSEIGRRAMVVSDETGTYRLAVAGAPEHPTGIPEVDYILGAYREQVLG